jgi:KAP family P-loop domain
MKSDQEQSDHPASESTSSHFAEKRSHEPSGSSERPPAQGWILARLRRVRRSTWLALAVIVLLFASICWYLRLQSWDTHQAVQARRGAFLSEQWWSEPVVYNADAALPEISGRLYGVGVQRVGTGERIWVVGAKGFLAYSSDRGQCWTPFTYQAAIGAFREETPNPCQEKQSAQIQWPDLVLHVHAAEPQSSSPRQQSPAQSNPNNSSAQRNYRNTKMNAASQRPQSIISVDPPTIDFGPITASGNTPGPPDGTVTVSNNGEAPLKIIPQKSAGDETGEFHVDIATCEKEIPPKGACTIHVRFFPKIDGKKQFQLLLYHNSEVLANVTVRASATGFGSASKNNPENPAARSVEPSKKPIGKTGPDKVPSTTQVPGLKKDVTPPASSAPKWPTTAPDLLEIGFASGSRIVSTGGALWTQHPNGDWVFTPQTSGTSVQISGRPWTMGGIKGTWATETWAPTLTGLVANDETSRRHLELRWRVNGTGTDTSWRSGNEPETTTAWPDSQLRSLVFDGAGGAWVAGWSGDQQGEHAVLARFDDRVRTWQPLTRGTLPPDRRSAAANSRTWMWMPRWYLAMLFVSLALALPALLPPLEVEPGDGAERESVEGRLSSDKPLDPGDRDVLGLTEIALGLSAFLRNEKTLPPLTIAINGEWGTGKSSLMNLLRCDLKSYGMCPVWFNAWHHQKEEHLLAALLQTIKLEAVPPLWNLLGTPFRSRLIAYRLRRRWPLLVITATVATFLVMLDYHLRIDPRAPSDLFQWVTNQILPSINTKAAAPSSTLPLQGGLIALLTAIAALWKGLTAFGANPASLLASVAQGNKMKDLEAQTSFRQKFAVEFRDFTKALGNSRPLVIFIDDLDRCLPANVRDVLEAVNFLVSSGDCFVVLGMDRVQVRRAVGLSFKDVAEEAGPSQARKTAASGAASTPQAIADAAAEAAREKRAEFAQKYLEKLVNLEVRVPLADDDKVKQGLFEKDPVAKAISFQERSLRAGLKTLRWGVPAVLVLLLLWGSYHYSLSAAFAVERWMAENREPSPTTNGSQIAGTATSPSAPSPTTVTTTKPSSPAKANPVEPAGELVEPVAGPAPLYMQKTVWPAHWMLSLPLYLAAVFLLLVANVVLTTRPGVVTHDSQQFTNAMEKVWYALVLEKQNTPRAAKRFVNRVRYLAMRQRYYRDQASLWERTLFPQRLASPARDEKASRIPEPLMIALAAMEQSDPAWVYDDGVFKNIVEGKDLPVGPLATARGNHCTEFSSSKTSQWAFLPNYRNEFLRIWPRLSREEVEEEMRLAATG